MPEATYAGAGIVGGAGYYYFGSTASELVTTDLAAKAPFSGRSLLLNGVTVDRVVAASVLVNAYTTYPCLILVIQVGLPPTSHTAGLTLLHMQPWALCSGCVASCICPL